MRRGRLKGRVSLFARGIALVVVMAFALLVVAAWSAPVSAQVIQNQPSQRSQGFGSFFQQLFGGPTVARPPPPKRQSSPRVKRVRRAPVVPAVPVVEKDPDARKILVVGDFVAAGLAWGLDQTFAEEPRLAVVDETKGASGLVRDDFYDWNKALPTFLNDDKPDIVVVVLGSNDRQSIRDGSARLAVHSDSWEKAYSARVTALVDTLKVYGRPFFWMGAPPMRTNSVSEHMVYVNGLVKPIVEAAGGHFVDIWDGFTNENGHYVGSGPDVDGQVRALRTRDGINFTRAGRLKLAFYVGRDIRRQTGLGAGSVDLLPATSVTGHIEVGPDGKKRMVGPVISLSDPLPGASETLAGGDEAAAPPADAASLQYKLIVKGEPPPPVVGRVDDFSWPPTRRSAAPAPTADASAAATEADGPALTPVEKAQ